MRNLRPVQKGRATSSIQCKRRLQASSSGVPNSFTQVQGLFCRHFRVMLSSLSKRVRRQSPTAAQPNSVHIFGLHHRQAKRRAIAPGRREAILPFPSTWGASSEKVPTWRINAAGPGVPLALIGTHLFVAPPVARATSPEATAKFGMSRIADRHHASLWCNHVNPAVPPSGQS